MIFFLFLQIEYQVLNRPHDAFSQELAIHFIIPKHELKFMLEDSLFFANYETRLKVYDKSGHQVAGDYWIVKRLEDSLAIHDSVKIVIPKTSSYYNLKILNLQGGEIFNATDKILALNFIGNIQWELLDNKLRTTFSVINEKGEIDSMLGSLSGRKFGKPIIPGTYYDSLVMLVGDLTNDTYQLKLELFKLSRKIDQLTIAITIARPFYLDEKAWALKVDQLTYLATPSEMDKLKKAAELERDSLWHDFWKQYDPTPNTEYNEREVEYFARIAYSEQNFGHGDRGWRSDRARIYVKYGAPDEIVSRPYEIHAKPYETWFYYRMNLKFIFADKYGFGEYVLLNPLGTNI